MSQRPEHRRRFSQPVLPISPHTTDVWGKRCRCLYLRFVYARGLSRPDPQDIAQALSWSILANGANRYAVSFGNASLKAETGDDVNILFDHY